MLVILILFFYFERVHLVLVVVNRIARVSDMIGRVTLGVCSISNKAQQQAEINRCAPSKAPVCCMRSCSSNIGAFKP